MEIHATHPPQYLVAGMTSHITGEEQRPYWHIARDTKDSSWHSPGVGSRPCAHTLAGHLRDEVMSIELPVENPFD
jgi:hypothetical protein